MLICLRAKDHHHDSKVEACYYECPNQSVSNCDANVPPEQKWLATKALDSPSSHSVWSKVGYTNHVSSRSWSEKGTRSENLFEYGVAVHVYDVDSGEFMHYNVYHIDPLTLNKAFISYKSFPKWYLASRLFVLCLILDFLRDLSDLLRGLDFVNFADCRLGVLNVILLQAKYWSVGRN